MQSHKLHARTPSVHCPKPLHLCGVKISHRSLHTPSHPPTTNSLLNQVGAKMSAIDKSTQQDLAGNYRQTTGGSLAMTSWKSAPLPSSRTSFCPATTQRSR